MVLAPAPVATAHWHGQDVTLTHGGAALVGSTDGWWRAPAGLRGIELDLPATVLPITDAELHRVNDPYLLLTNPVLSSLVRPALVGMAGRLNTLVNADPVQFAAAWTSLVTMLVRSMTGHDLNGVELAPARRVQARRFIRAQLTNPNLSPADVAAGLYLSRRSLYEAFATDDQARAGHGVAAEIRRLRLERARELLLDATRTDTVADIAAQVGLPDPAHFSRAFRAEYGHSPHELRAHPLRAGTQDRGDDQPDPGNMV